MKSSKQAAAHHSARRTGFSIWSLAIAVVLGFCGATGVTTVHAQATSGRLFGWAPAGQTIKVHSTSGVRRHVKVNTKGHYSIGSLPMGIYNVTLEKDDKPVDTRSNIKLTAGGGAEVDFACEHDQCAESANNQG